jgi:hypothetical protein
MLDPDAATHCLDCGAPISGRYCASCGQRTDPLHRSLREFFSEFTEGLTNFDAKLWRTLPALIAKPGLLTAEFNAGRRTRYVHPFRVYLFVTFVFFGLLAVFGKPATFVQRGQDGKAGVQELQQVEDAKLSPLERSIVTGGQKLAKASDREVLDQFVQRLPQVMFALLPVAALLLKLAYGRKRYYVEHLVFVTHMHSFVFVLLGALVVLPSLPFGLSQIIPFSITAVYFVLAVKRVYGQGWAVTLGKAMALGLGYSVVLSMAMAAATVLVMVGL